MHATGTLAAVFLTLTACASGRDAAALSGDVRPDDRPVLVNVTDNYVLPAEIWASGCGTSYRLGTVHPGIVSHYVLRQSLLLCGGVVEFAAQPAGTEPLVKAGRELLKAGDVVDFVITTHLVASYTWVRS